MALRVYNKGTKNETRKEIKNMFKYTYINYMPFSYDPSRKGSKYLIGDKYKNHGEFLESVAKFHRGLDYLVNPTTSWDTGSDIESLHASIKSSKSSLARVYGPSFEAIKETYFANVASTTWIFMIDIGDEITEYHMNASEFSDFLDAFGATGIESGSHLMKIRIQGVSKKMIVWFEEHCE